MCTVVLSLRPGHPWPILLAANRDERVDRPWEPPAAHWPERPGVVAGRDLLGGGTWMAMRDGVVAAVLNRPGSLGPAPGKLSRGDLPLQAVEHSCAAQAAAALATLEAGAYRSFNMVVADCTGAWFVRGLGVGRPDIWVLEPGVHIVTAHDPDDPASPRGAAYLPRFRDAAAPDPARGDWDAWTTLLADRSGGGTAINVPERDGFGTVCSSLVALPDRGAPAWLFAAGPPDRAPFRPVLLPCRSAAMP